MFSYHGYVNLDYHQKTENRKMEKAGSKQTNTSDGSAEWQDKSWQEEELMNCHSMTNKTSVGCIDSEQRMTHGSTQFSLHLKTVKQLNKSQMLPNESKKKEHSFPCMT